jgi:hypothetical protein
MADTSLQTTRFAFQKIGDGQISATASQTASAGVFGKGSQELEPRDYNAILQCLDSNLPLFQNASSTFTAGTNTAITSQASSALQVMRLTFTNVVISVTNALNYGSQAVLTWPNTNIQVVDARWNLTTTKDGTGLIATDTPDVALGSAAASNKTLATTMIDTIEQVATAGTLVATIQHNGPHTNGIRYIAAGTTNKLYMNVGISANGGSADGTLTVSGTADIFFIDTGVYS